MLLGKTETGLWVDLLKEGQERARVSLSETQESYVVFMLQRFTRKPDLMNTTLALAYLETKTESRTKKQDTLWDTADAALILAGLFPERAKRKNVSVSYFTDMSKICYFDLANIFDELRQYPEADQYRKVGADVERLAYVLYCTRRKNTTVRELLGMHSPDILH